MSTLLTKQKPYDAPILPNMSFAEETLTFHLINAPDFVLTCKTPLQYSYVASIASALTKRGFKFVLDPEEQTIRLKQIAWDCILYDKRDSIPLSLKCVYPTMSIILRALKNGAGVGVEMNTLQVLGKTSSVSARISEIRKLIGTDSVIAIGVKTPNYGFKLSDKFLESMQKVAHRSQTKLTPFDQFVPSANAEPEGKIPVVKTEGKIPVVKPVSVQTTPISTFKLDNWKDILSSNTMKVAEFMLNIQHPVSIVEISSKTGIANVDVATSINELKRCSFRTRNSSLLWMCAPPLDPNPRFRSWAEVIDVLKKWVGQSHEHPTVAIPMDELRGVPCLTTMCAEYHKLTGYKIWWRVIMDGNTRYIGIVTLDSPRVNTPGQRLNAIKQEHPPVVPPPLVPTISGSASVEQRLSELEEKYAKLTAKLQQMTKLFGSVSAMDQ